LCTAACLPETRARSIGYDRLTGDRDRRVRAPLLATTSTPFDSCRRLEYRPWPAVVRGDRLPGYDKSRFNSVAGGGSQRSTDAPSQRREGNCSKAADELCLRSRI